MNGSGSALCTHALLRGRRQANLDGAELVTLYRGSDISEAEAFASAVAIQGAFDLETEVVYGGQPFYPYIFSVE